MIFDNSSSHRHLIPPLAPRLLSRGFLLPSSFICEVVLATRVDMDVGYFATQSKLVAIADDECKKIRVTGNFVSGLGILQELLL